MADGTEIYVISGAQTAKPKVKQRIGGAVTPGNLTADSEPQYDEWGWGDYWSCQAFKQWHELNVAAYGQATANSKFLAAWEIAFDRTGGAHEYCCYDSNFRNYFKNQGVDLDTLLCSIFMPTVEVVSNLAEGAASGSEGIKKTLDFAASAMPWIAAGGIIYFGDKFLGPIFYKKDKKEQAPAVSGIAPESPVGWLAVGVAAFGMWRYFARKPKIKILNLDAANRGVSFVMSVNGKSFSDTYWITDPPNLVPFGDSAGFWGLAWGKPELGQIELHIGYKDNTGGFRAVYGQIISYPQPNI